MTDPSAAEKAMRELNGVMLDGRAIRMNEAKRNER
jgi:RNA recognition motif-containing protein